jgi:hypothetical protein
VHTEHVPKLGWYEWVFVTPSNHRVHHAQNDIYLDRNYGGIFILWDRLFGTFQEELASEPPVYGIRGALKSWNPVRALTHIYVDMFRDSWHTARWRDKLRVWVGRTGWRPDDVARRFPHTKTDLADFHKFDPAVSPLVGCYAFGQLVAAVVLLDYMQKTSLTYWGGFALWATLLAGTVTTALWLEGWHPQRLLRWELLRLGALSLLLLAAWSAGVGSVILLAGILYTLANLLLLFLLQRRPVSAGPLAAH